MKQIAFAFLAAMAAALQAAEPREYFVDCTHGDNARGGLSEADALRTVQAAVDKTRDGDIVTLLPGHYRDGGCLAQEGDVFSRVFITNNITLRSKGGRSGRDSTFIHGLRATEISPNDLISRGLGQDAVRCIRVAASGKNTRIEGLTLLDGATDCVNTPSWQLDCNRGGGVYAKDGATVVDCVISNCVSTYGGGMYGGVAARTLVSDNYSKHGGSAGYDVSFFHSVVTRSEGGVTFNVSKIYNCTLAENHSSYSASKWVSFKVHNCVILHNVDNAAVPYADLKNSVLDKKMVFYSGEVGADKDLADDSSCKILNMDAAENQFQFLAPALDDYRPLPESALVGAGSKEVLAAIPEEFRNIDYGGEAFDPEKGVNAGAFQRTANPCTGAVVLNGEWKSAKAANYCVNGKERMVSGLYAFAEKFPVQICLGNVLPKDSGYAFWGFAAEGADTLTRFPQRDGTTWVLPPPKGKVLTLTAKATSLVYWVDPNAAEDAVKDGKQATPFKTIQDAVNVISLEKEAVVFAAAGDYAEGATTAISAANRVYFGAKWIRVVATDGPESTRIVGESDNSDPTYGIGSDSVRCVAFGGSAGSGGKQALCGFTLTGGRAADGGAARGWGDDARLIDCVISDCCAGEGAAAYGVTLERCRVIGCTAKSRGMLRSGTASSSVFEDVRTGESTSYVFAEACKTWHCTVVQPSNAVQVHLFYGAGGKHVNDVFESVYGIGDYESAFSGCIVWNWGWFGAGHDGLIQQDPMVAGGDGVSLSAFSPAVGLAESSDADYYKYVTTDIGGRPLSLAQNGRPVSGASQRLVPTVRVVSSSSGQLSGDGISPLGTNYVYAGETLTLAATDTARRNLAGFKVNGELVPGGTSYEVGVPPDAVLTQEVSVAAEYVPRWYVDPNGNDDNNGWSWATPKKTLEAVMFMAVSNDTVYAAPGAYTNGTMLQSRALYSGVPHLRARVVVPSFVTLESRDGPESTFIVGEPAPVGQANEYGCGTGAVRCVAMEANARLKGFTITGGRCYYDINSNDDNNRGAGVISDRFTGLVSDCIISNNVAHDAGGALFGRYARCRFLENTATRVCSAARNMVAWGCYFDRNRGPYPVTYWQKLVGCTIGPDNVTLEGKPAPLGTSPESGSGWSSPEVCGTLICSASLQSGAVLALTNCAFSSQLLPNWPAGVTTNDTCVIAPSGELVCVDGVPAIGCNAAIDRGEAQWWVDEYCGSTDALGSQRVYNGAMDIGCFEADWRPEYSKILGRGVEVVAAAPNVRKLDSRTVLVGNGSMALDYVRRGLGRSRCSFVAKVEGDGELDVERNDQAFAVLREQDGERTFQFDAGTGAERFVFSYASQSGDGGALIGAFRSNAGQTIILR